MRRLLLILVLLAACTQKDSAPKNPADPAPPMKEDKATSTTEARGPDQRKKEELAYSPNADPLSASAEITSGKVEIKGSLAPEDIVGVIKKSLPGIKFCYDEARKKEPTLSGKMKISFVISSNGDVLEAKTKEGISSELDECVSRKFAQFKFPPPQRGTVEVTYPLVFTTN